MKCLPLSTTEHHWIFIDHFFLISEKIVKLFWLNEPVWLIFTPVWTFSPRFMERSSTEGNFHLKTSNFRDWVKLWPFLQQKVTNNIDKGGIKWKFLVWVSLISVTEDEQGFPRSILIFGKTIVLVRWKRPNITEEKVHRNSFPTLSDNFFFSSLCSAV